MRRVFLVLGIILLILFCISVFLLKVKSVSCFDQMGQACPSQITGKLTGFVNSRLFNTEKRIRTILSQDPQVLSYSVNTSPLGNITVKVQLRDASIALKPENSSVYTLYTKDGVVVRESEQTDLPVILLKEQLDTDSIQFTASFGYELTTVLPISEMKIVGSSLIVTLRDQRVVYYPLQGDIDLLLGTTLATFSQLNQGEGKLMINGKAVVIHEIDFRFKNPVLR